MSIIYSVVAKEAQGGIVNLCSYDAAHGNYPTITNSLLSRIKIIENITYKYSQEYNFHIVKDGILLFVCLADSNLKLRTALAFLEEIRKKFKEKFSNEEIMVANAYDMSAAFSQVYRNQVNFFNSNKDQDKKELLMKQLSHMQAVMGENIEKVLQREEKVEIVVKKTKNIDYIADEIKKNTNDMKKQAFLAKHRCKILIGACVVAAAGGLFFII